MPATVIDKLLQDLRTDAPVQRVLVSAFWTAVVLATDPPRCGLASTMRPLTHPNRPPVRAAGQLAERRGRDLAELLRSSSTLEASIGMAAFNALKTPDEEDCIEVNALDLLLERGTARRVAFVGHFPFVHRVARVAADCQVLELHPQSGDLPAEQAPAVLPQADVIALTGTSLLNHTFDGLIEHCRRDTFIVMLGASTPFSPVLFDYGIDVLAGTKVVDPSAALHAIAEGATFSQVPGKKLLTMRRVGQSE